MAALLLGLALLFQNAPHGTVYVLESTRSKTIGRATYPVYVDDDLVCKLDGGRYVALWLPPGEHTFHSKSKKKGGVVLNVKEGQSYYLRLEIEEGGFFVRDNGIKILPNEEGAYSLKQLKVVEQKDIRKPSLIAN